MVADAAQTCEAEINAPMAAQTLQMQKTENVIAWTRMPAFPAESGSAPTA